MDYFWGIHTTESQFMPACVDAFRAAAPEPVEVRPSGAVLPWHILYDLLHDPPAEYVLFTRDDHVPLRTLPIEQTLGVMERHGLNHVTFDHKDRPWQARWGWDLWEVEFCPDGSTKLHTGETRHTEGPFNPGILSPPARKEWADLDLGYLRRPSADVLDSDSVFLTLSDHWHIPTPGLWRVSVVLGILEGWAGRPDGFRWIDILNGLNAAGDGPWNDHQTRIKHQKTYVCGPFHTPAYVKNLTARPRGGKPA